jgi:hypothetical protein
VIEVKNQKIQEYIPFGLHLHIQFPEYFSGDIFNSVCAEYVSLLGCIFFSLGKKCAFSFTQRIEG